MKGHKEFGLFTVEKVLYGLNYFQIYNNSAVISIFMAIIALVRILEIVDINKIQLVLVRNTEQIIFVKSFF